MGFNGLAEIGKHIFLTWDQAASSLCCQTSVVESSVEFSKVGYENWICTSDYKIYFSELQSYTVDIYRHVIGIL